MVRKLIAKHTSIHFIKGKIYNAIYETQPGDEGWFIHPDETGAIHWLNRRDNHKHTVIEREAYVTDNFLILP